MLERFTREKQRASRGTAFNLEDEDELTHYGQSLSKLDDFDNAGLTLDDEDEDATIQVYCRQHNQKVLDKKEFLSPLTGKWVKYEGRWDILQLLI